VGSSLSGDSKNTAFYLTTQWVGKFYHYHDVVLFIFLTIIAVVFLISLILDWSDHKPIGDTIQDIWDYIQYPESLVKWPSMSEKIKSERL
jgi:hypothetical protein